MKEYNGHKNYTHWNVSLWINNDEGLYRLAQECRRMYKDTRKAAQRFVRLVGTERTPDGARWSIAAVAEAMRGV